MRELDTLYAFTDVAGEHVLNIGPGGWDWTPIDSPLAETEAFVVCGEDNARDFQRWQENEGIYHRHKGFHIRRVEVGVDDRCPDRWIWLEPIDGTRPRNEVTG